MYEALQNCFGKTTFGCLLRVRANGKDAQTARVVREVELYPSIPQLSLCFVNTRVNFAQENRSLETLSGGLWEFAIWFFVLPCMLFSLWANGQRCPQVEACLTRHFEARWSKDQVYKAVEMSLEEVQHLTFTDASLSLTGDHLAALHPASCKSDCIVLSRCVTTTGQSPVQRYQVNDALPLLCRTA